MKANATEYLFSVNTHTPPTMIVDSGEEFTVEVRGAFDDVEDISAVPTPFTPACDGHPLAPITGPIVVRGAKPGDVVAIDLIELTPFGSGKSAILRDFGVLRREFPEPMVVSSEVREGRAWFGGRISLPLNPNLGTISTMPPEGYKPSYAGAYGGDFDQKRHRSREPDLSPGSGRERACVPRRSPRRDQRWDHHRDRRRMQHEGSGPHQSPEGPHARATDYSPSRRGTFRRRRSEC